jgi:hypothetical protein
LVSGESFGSLAYDSAAFVLVTMTGASRYDGTIFLPLSYDLVSLTWGSLPSPRSLTIWMAAVTRLRVSLLMVEYCSPAMMDFTDSTSESWPVTTGTGLPEPLTEVMTARARVSLGDSTPSRVLPVL